MSVRNGVTVRGTSNRNERGSAASRRRRKEWLLETYAANRQLTRVVFADGWVNVGDFLPAPDVLLTYENIVEVEQMPTCRCYRCGRLLWFETLTVDRIIPGCKGGTYRRDNIRPACPDCNSETGGPLSRGKEHQAAKKAARKKKAAE